jgi:hypothetical protein
MKYSETASEKTTMQQYDEAETSDFERMRQKSTRFSQLL